jgi:hypothetical protein
MKETVNLIIFRIPDADGDMMFVEIPYLDGKLHGQGTRFTVENPEDNYLTMGFYHIVLAQTTREGSLDLCRFAFGEGENAAVIHELSYDALSALVKEAINAYEHSTL